MGLVKVLGQFAVHNGESVLDPRLLRAVLDTGDTRRRAAGADEAPAALSRIGVDLLRLVADGLTDREIGHRLRAGARPR